MIRIPAALAVLLAVAMLLFLMLRVIPGNPVAAMMGEHVNAETVERMTAELGLDRPLGEQFLRYLSGAVRGDFGTSYSLGKPVGRLMGAAFGNTLSLAVGAALFAWTLGLVCGVIAAVKRNRIPDRLFMGMSLMGVSMPVFMAAMLMQYLFAYHLHWLPISGTESWKGFILPSVSLGWNAAGSIARLVRSSLTEVMSEDYIRTARAKGRKPMGVLMTHAMRNALLPVVTMMAMQFSSLLSGAVITETVFSINGIGRMAVQAITARDLPLMQGTVLFSTAVVILGNLVADSLYSVLDPRIRVSGD